MANEHDRYDGLAVGHVLGGLSGPDASDFRSHLAGCQDCRRRVAELRGIADELTEVERDERSRVPLQTEVVRRDATEQTASAPARRLTIGHVTLATIVVLLLAAGMAFWNLHLRTVVTAYEAVTESQSEALRDLATGVQLEAELSDGVTGMMVASGDEVAFTLAGLELRDDEIVVVWTRNVEGEVTQEARAPADLITGGTYAGVVDTANATEVMVTVEARNPGAEPEGPILARSQLRGRTD